MAAPIKTGSRLELGKPAVLFEIHDLAPNMGSGYLYAASHEEDACSSPSLRRGHTYPRHRRCQRERRIRQYCAKTMRFSQVVFEAVLIDYLQESLTIFTSVAFKCPCSASLFFMPLSFAISFASSFMLCIFALETTPVTVTV